MKRLGLFGGSFNPIHRGHLALARAALCELSLDLILLVPAATPPHKERDPDMAPAVHRLRMTELALAQEPCLAASDVEIRREGRSYTVDTVLELKRLHPEASVFLLVGGDWWQGLERWHRADLLFRLVELVLVNRPGWDPVLPDLPTPVHRVFMEPDPVSSTLIRSKLRSGESIHGLVPEAVEAYIREHGLYR